MQVNKWANDAGNSLKVVTELRFSFTSTWVVPIEPLQQETRGENANDRDFAFKVVLVSFM